MAINTKILNNLRADIQDEYGAIKNYDDHADFAESLGHADIASTLRDIRDEEKVHIGELQNLLGKYDDVFLKSLSDGKKEVDEELEEAMVNWETASDEEKQKLKEKGSIFSKNGRTYVISPDGYHRAVYEKDSKFYDGPGSAGYQKYKEEKYKKNLKESAIDPVHQERCRDLFIDDNTIRPDVVDYIWKVYNDWVANLKNPPKLKAMYLTGSLLGYMYSSDTDLDVHIHLDLTDDELDALKKASRPALVNIPNTAHPIELTLRNDEENFANDESVYDMVAKKFLKLIEKEKVGTVPVSYIAKIARFFMNGTDIAIGDANRHISDYEFVKSREIDDSYSENDSRVSRLS